MAKNRISLFVFDMAGTTVNEDNVVYKTLRKAVNDLGHNFSLETVLLIGGGQEKYQAIKDILRSAYADEIVLEKQAKTAYQNFLHMLKDAYKKLKVVPYEGADALFEHLKKQGLKVVLNTGYNRNTAESLLKKLKRTKSTYYGI